MAEGLESRIRAAWESGDLALAAERTLEGYGREVLGMLVATLRDEQDASDVFSQTAEDLWRTLSDFEWRCSMRTWIYMLAHHAAARFRREAAVHRRTAHVSLSRAEAVAQRIRSSTLPYLRSEVKDKFASLRDGLDVNERTLLILRVDRKLSWSEIAQIMAQEGEEHAKVAARLRKRFQLVKNKLRQRAIEAGVLKA